MPSCSFVALGLRVGGRVDRQSPGFERLSRKHRRAI